ncbi:HAD-IA family hydrolase [Candidatus Sororendozoicomonas aggregata]|uniref:HAD family hydrolase n=1 Tax=Candidatus Sororendozoicomonas aggregata TaxID=3073239 RepID=UPI002ED58909
MEKVKKVEKVKKMLMKKSQVIEGVFFDLDGTLMDTAADFVVALNQFATDHQRPPLEEDVIRQHISAGSKVLVSLVLDIPHEHPQMRAKQQLFLTHYGRHINQPLRQAPATLYPGASQLLNELDQRSITWGIVTNKPIAYTTPILAQAQLTHRSAATVCPEHVAKPKPDPQALLLACEQANCNPENCVYIGDHQRDIEAGKRAGMVTIAALYGYIPDDDCPSEWQADYQANTMTDIHQWLQAHQWQLPEPQLMPC